MSQAVAFGEKKLTEKAESSGMSGLVRRMCDHVCGEAVIMRTGEGVAHGKCPPPQAPGSEA